MNEVLDAIYGRRSIRKYKDKKVPEKIIEQLLGAAVMAPSAMHKEHWRFIVIEDQKRIRQLSDKVVKSMKLMGLVMRIIGFVKKKASIFYDAPLLIIVTGKKDYKWAKIDVGILAQTMMLTGHSLGLGSCYIGFGNHLNNDEDTLMDLGVPEDHEIIAPLIFGYPDEKKKTPKRKPEVLNWIE